MKTWLKGGLIGVAVWIFILILFTIGNLIPMDCSRVSLGEMCSIHPFTTILIFPVHQVIFKQADIIFKCSGHGGPDCSEGFPLTLIEFFILGAVIGLIIQKIKERKK